MPSDEELVSKSEEWKVKGNEAFTAGNVQDAIASYSQGIVVCDRIVAMSAAGATTIKATLLSNRAMCYLKTMQFQECVDDCNTALSTTTTIAAAGCTSASTSTTTTSTTIDAKLRSKLLFRRAKGRFLLSNLPITTSNTSHTLLQDAGKDLYECINIDKTNKEAAQLLTAVRTQHKVSKEKAATPVSQTLQYLQDNLDTNHNIKLLLGLLDNDTTNASMELGRLGGVSTLFRMCQTTSATLSESHSTPDERVLVDKTACLAAHCLSQACSYPAFVRAHMNTKLHQEQILNILQSQSHPDLFVSLLALYDRIILHLDRDDPEQDISNKTLIDSSILVKICNTALSKAGDDKTVVRAVLDVVSAWTAGRDRDACARAALADCPFSDPQLAVPVTQAEIRAMSAKEHAIYRKRTFETKKRDDEWATTRAIQFAKDILPVLLETATIKVEDHMLRREITVVVGRMVSQMDDPDKGESETIKKALRPYLNDPSSRTNTGPKKKPAVIIEEIYNDDGDDFKEEEEEEEEEDTVPLEKMMGRALVTAAALLSRKDMGAWALGSGWDSCSDDLVTLINSQNDRAMCLASEVISGAATIEGARPMISNLMLNGHMDKLLLHPERDIRSGAASAVTKLGLADKETGKDEGEQVSMLQGACDLLEDRGEQGEGKEEDSKPFLPQFHGANVMSSSSKDSGKDKLRLFSSFAGSSVERGIEMMNYLVANTNVKEEVAAGFASSVDAPHSALERLVEICSMPSAGESVSGFALASIFQQLAVTNQMLRKEAFEDKEVTMEQYDELQKMGKTEEEKDLLEEEKDKDTTAACHERIRRMATANVPRAMVNLVEGASESTLEQLCLAMNRMADEPSVRGVLIQQGVLSACIKVEKNECATDTEIMTRVIRLSRHCIAKILVTTNPSLLTSAQRLGSIRPLLMLIRDIKAKDLQHFEALMALTNIASSGEDAQNRIVSEKGIPALTFAMFSDHEMVQQAATEAMSNLFPHKAFMEHLAEDKNLNLWLAFASDYEERYECARAAAGCLAMATQDETIALSLAKLEKFGPFLNECLESGRLEIMHRVLALVMNLLQHGGKCKERCIKEGLAIFCLAYVQKYHDGESFAELDFPPNELPLLPVTLDLARKIVQLSDG